MIKFNFFEDEKNVLLEKFCQYFRLEKEIVSKYFGMNNLDMLTYVKVVEDLQLKLDDFDSSDVEIVCRHMTTTSEEGIRSFFEYGLLDLRSMLQFDTPLSQHLKKYGVEVKVDEKIIKIDEKDYQILSSQEICENCFNGGYVTSITVVT